MRRHRLGDYRAGPEPAGEVSSEPSNLPETPTMRMTTKLLLGGGLLATTALVFAQPGQRGGKGGFPGGPGGPGGGGFPGGPGGPGGFGRPPMIGQLLPPFLADQLKLTDDQKKQLEELQKSTEATLDKLLTDDQRKQLKEMKERGPGRGGFPGGPGGGRGGRGGPGGGPGGPGGPGGGGRGPGGGDRE